MTADFTLKLTKQRETGLNERRIYKIKYDYKSRSGNAAANRPKWLSAASARISISCSNCLFYNISFFVIHLNRLTPFTTFNIRN
jgi:hypothetical protein